MKPSNTGRDWLKEWQECEDVPILSAMLVYKGDTDKGFIDLCEWAAQVAIAEYRKEAKAEWQRELAAKVEGLPRFAPITKDGPGFSHFAMMDEYSGGDWVRLSDMRALLNENDDHAE